MNEIYWITRFDAIKGVSLFLMIAGGILLVGFFIAWIGNYCTYKSYQTKEYYSSAEEYKGYSDICMKVIKWLAPITIIGMLSVVFIPTTKQALLIYGIGGTIDYLKQNPTAQKLPDKCIIALDKWVDSMTIEEKDSLNKN